MWKQRAGHAGRSAGINAHVILLAEKSMFQCRKKRKKKGGNETDQDGASSESEPDEEDKDEGDYVEEVDEEGTEWMKKVEGPMQGWIKTEDC